MINMAVSKATCNIISVKEAGGFIRINLVLFNSYDRKAKAVDCCVNQTVLGFLIFFCNGLSCFLYCHSVLFRFGV